MACGSSALAVPDACLWWFAAEAHAVGAGWNRLDDAGRAAWLAADPRVHAAWKMTRVRAEMRDVRVVTYAKAHHYLFIRRQREVLDEIEKFLSAIPAPPAAATPRSR